MGRKSLDQWLLAMLKVSGLISDASSKKVLNWKVVWKTFAWWEPGLPRVGDVEVNRPMVPLASNHEELQAAKVRCCSPSWTNCLTQVKDNVLCSTLSHMNLRSLSRTKSLLRFRETLVETVLLMVFAFITAAGFFFLEWVTQMAWIKSFPYWRNVLVTVAMS